MKSLLNLVSPVKLVLYLVLFGAGIYAGVSIVRYKPELFYLKVIPKDQLEATLLSEKVGKLMSLPTDEQPTVETIADLAFLKDRPFFIKAEVGDKVLVYEKATLAILYRPSKNIIISTLSPNYGDAIFSKTSPSPIAVITPVPTPIPTVIPSPVVTPVPSVVPSLSPAPSVTPVATASPKPVAK